MSYNNNLRQAIIGSITSPADPKISGIMLQQKLLAIVDAIGAGGVFLGTAATDTVPGTAVNGFYLATTVGTYTNFIDTSAKPLVIAEGEIALLSSIEQNGNIRWAKNPLPGRGEAAYIHIMYAESQPAQDSDMHDTFQQATDKYIGICADANATAPTDYRLYTWAKFVGEDGAPGADGHNPNLGTYLLDTTTEPPYPIDAPATAQDGDYIVVIDESQQPPTQRQWIWDRSLNDNAGGWKATTVDPGAQFATGEYIAATKVINNVKEGGEHNVLSAELGKKLMAVDYREEKATIDSTNILNGFLCGKYYKSNDNSIKYLPDVIYYHTTLQYALIPINGAKSVRFLTQRGVYVSGTAFFNISDVSQLQVAQSTGASLDVKQYMVGYNFPIENLQPYEVFDKIIDVPEGANYFFVQVKLGSIDLDDFYCYLCYGNKAASEGEIGAINECIGVNTIIKKNYLDELHFISGMSISGGVEYSDVKGIMSNKIEFIPNLTYTLQGIPTYGNNHNIFVAYYDAADNYLGRFAISTNGDDVATATFTMQPYPNYAYCRVVLQTSFSAAFNFSLAQIELGSRPTAIVGYNTEHHWIGGTISRKKAIRLLSIGNSYSQDALAYVPYILKNMGLDVDIQIGILMQSSSELSWHVDNFNNEAANYYFYLFNKESNSWQEYTQKTIQWALDNYEWDLISLQQSSSEVFNWSSYQPYLNQLINLISGYVDYPIKFGWYAVQSRPASVNSGANWSDETITDHYESICTNAQKVMNETVCEFLVPVCTAIQNARTITALKAIGGYAQNNNNASGLGYLTPNDGVHLQEGLPCQIAAYSFILEILRLYGFDNMSINGEGSRCDAAWAVGKSIPAPHGDYIGITDANVLIGQKCAIIASKTPYQVTDMNAIKGSGD